MDTTQVLLTVTLTITTIFLVIIGIQLIFLLRELRKTMKKVNGIIEGFEKAGLFVEHGWTEALGFFSGIKTLVKFIDVFHQRKNGKQRSS